MTISSISSTTPTTPLSNVSAISGSLAASDPGAVAGAGSDTTQLSKMGDLMSKLQSLESSDPAKAKQVLTQIATTLKSQAGSDPKLASVAAKFDQAAQTGNLSALQPNQGGGHHGGHHHHHGGGGSPPSDPPATTSTSTTSGKVASYQDSDPMAEVESAISSALAS
jgi:hypothetical protein